MESPCSKAAKIKTHALLFGCDSCMPSLMARLGLFHSKPLVIVASGPMGQFWAQFLSRHLQLRCKVAPFEDLRGQGW